MTTLLDPTDATVPQSPWDTDPQPCDGLETLAFTCTLLPTPNVHTAVVELPPMQLAPGSVADAGAARLAGSTNNASKAELEHIAIV